MHPLFAASLLPLILLLSSSLSVEATGADSSLTVVHQDYHRALEEAASQDKLLFVDFYTTWCGPCKQLDKYVFENDSVATVLGQDIVLLKYDAEQDTVFHLSKKYHVNSYPTGLLLTPRGEMLTRSTGFSGSDAPALSASVAEFVSEGQQLRKAGKIVSGYTPTIDPASYPAFYKDYVNRTDTDVDANEINNYLLSVEDKLSESFTSVLFYFVFETTDAVTDIVLNDKAAYAERYGMSTLESFTSMVMLRKFSAAVENQDEAAFEAAKAFTEAEFGKEEAEKMATSFRRDLLQAQGRWREVTDEYRSLKEGEGMSNGYINHVSWQFFRECEDPEVLATWLGWMKQVVAEEPEFDYLDTYAWLLHKVEGKEAARPAIEAAIAAGKRDGRKTSKLEALLD